jgi:hypothetical protein
LVDALSRRRFSHGALNLARTSVDDQDLFNKQLPICFVIGQ